MRDLSLHILDLAQNSITAGASLVSIDLTIDDVGRLTFTLTTRKVGLGIPLMMENALRADGHLTIESEIGRGTKLIVTMDTGHIDCLPLGDLSGTLLSLMLTNPFSPDFRFEGHTRLGHCLFDTRDVRKVLGADIPLNEPTVAAWLSESLKEEIDPIFGGTYNEISG